jgi:hypothetical protein
MNEGRDQRESAMAETIAAIAGLCTYRHETKEEFIGRVRAVLGEDPDIRVSRIRQQRDELLAALQSISKITGDAGFNIGGPLEHCPGGLSSDDAKRLLSLACEYLKDTSKAASRAIASVESHGGPEKTAETEGGAS